MTRSSHSSDNILRQAIRGILQEEAGPGKSLELIARLQEINSGLAEAGLPAQVGVMIDRMAGIIEFSFALQDVPAGRDRPVRAGQSRAENAWAIANLIRQQKAGSAAWGTSAKARRVELEAEKIVSSRKALRAIAQIPKGSIEVSRAGLDRDDGGKCAGANIVRLTRPTTQGWGPLLYDLAMEHSSKGRSGGLAPDRFEVSGDANDVWVKYATARPDVEPQQLDVSSKHAEHDPKTWGDQLTPEDPSDDCAQVTAQTYAGGKRGAWRKSHLSRAYKKSDRSVTAALKAAGLFW